MLSRLTGLVPATALLGLKQMIGASTALQQCLRADPGVHHAVIRADIVPG